MEKIFFRAYHSKSSEKPEDIRLSSIPPRFQAVCTSTDCRQTIM